MKKSERQAVIAQLITEYPIATQEELMAKLKAEGIAATQATISRDIRMSTARRAMRFLRQTIKMNKTACLKPYMTW